MSQKIVIMHGVWKSQKKSHSILRAKQKLIKHIKKKFMKTWSLQSNRVTRYVNFNWTKIGGNCQNWKTQIRVNFKHCVWNTYPGFCSYWNGFTNFCMLSILAFLSGFLIILGCWTLLKSLVSMGLTKIGTNPDES